MMTPAPQSSKRPINILDSSDEEPQIVEHKYPQSNSEKRPRLESSPPFAHRQNGRSPRSGPVASSSRLPANPVPTLTRVQRHGSSNFRSSVPSTSRGNSQGTSSATLVSRERDVSEQPDSEIEFSYRAPIAETIVITDDDGDDDDKSYFYNMRFAQYADGLREDGPHVKETRDHVDELFRASVNEEPDIFDMEPIFDEIPVADERGLSRMKEGIYATEESEEWDDLEERFKAMSLGGMSRLDIEALKSFGNTPLHVAAGGICPRLELYKRSQLPRFPSGRKRLSGFHLTGRFTGMRPPRREM